MESFQQTARDKSKKKLKEKLLRKHKVQREICAKTIEFLKKNNISKRFHK